MTKNVLLCGVGGQGTVLASRLIALAAMEKGMEARGAETIGMAQRGGSVVSHVRSTLPSLSEKGRMRGGITRSYPAGDRVPDRRRLHR